MLNKSHFIGLQCHIAVRPRSQLFSATCVRADHTHVRTLASRPRTDGRRSPRTPASVGPLTGGDFPDSRVLGEVDARSHTWPDLPPRCSSQRPRAALAVAALWCIEARCLWLRGLPRLRDLSLSLSLSLSIAARGCCWTCCSMSAEGVRSLSRELGKFKAHSLACTYTHVSNYLVERG